MIIVEIGLVLGDKIDKNVYVDYQDKRVYFCCAGCVEVSKKNPGKYLKKIGNNSRNQSRREIAGSVARTMLQAPWKAWLSGESSSSAYKNLYTT